MSAQTTTGETVNQNRTKRQLSAIKVVKYLFISTLVLLIIGSFVLFCIAIDTISNTNEDIDTIEKFGITELAAKRNERLKQQSLYLLRSLTIWIFS